MKISQVEKHINLCLKMKPSLFYSQVSQSETKNQPFQ